MNKIKQYNDDVSTATPVLIPFNDSVIDAVKYEGQIQVNVRKTCEELGIDYPTQFTKIKSDDVLNRCIGFIPIHDSIGRLQQQLYINIKGYTLWLAGLTSTRVKEEVRPLLIKYKLEAADVLEQYFTNKYNEPVSQSQLILMLAQQNVDLERKVLQIESNQTLIVGEVEEVKEEMGKRQLREGDITGNTVARRLGIFSNGKESKPHVQFVDAVAKHLQIFQSKIGYKDEYITVTRGNRTGQIDAEVLYTELGYNLIKTLLMNILSPNSKFIKETQKITALEISKRQRTV
ncbi:phage antirepressor N-terminal domain-containing protein [Brevibacillus brevis]|uniref:phage antirepressor N-terminal domain-containing protein n=1 Tax=Brevibacillus brevis TaxID=1393 RepID=UPI0007D8B0F0|nr:phage antirepressor N-terminal domain-containing protein [Brevibacillus brevis]